VDVLSVVIASWDNFFFCIDKKVNVYIAFELEQEETGARHKIGGREKERERERERER
jgi:hypothetical protein